MVQRILEKLPERMNARWFLVWVMTSAILFAILSVGTLIALSLGAKLGAGIVIVYIYTLGADALLCLIAFLGGYKIYFFVSQVGLVAAGFIAIASAAEDHGGWEVFAATLIFLFIAAGTGIVGIISEVLYRKRARRDSFKNKSKKSQVSWWSLYFIFLLVLMLFAYVNADFDSRAYPEEIADVALFLAADCSSYLNGQAIAVDGGWTCY